MYILSQIFRCIIHLIKNKDLMRFFNHSFHLMINNFTNQTVKDIYIYRLLSLPICNV